MVIVKKAGEAHFTKKFDCGAKSDRVILPQDGCRVKVTHLTAPAGAEWIDISYSVDETVYVVAGELKLTIAGESQTLGAGDMYTVPAGKKYTVNVDKWAEVICFFSAVPGGPEVDND